MSDAAPSPETPAPGAAPPEDAVDVAWRELQGRWDDPRAHDAFLATCSAAGQMPFAGHCYKTVLDARPDDAQALRAKQRLLAQASAMLSLEAEHRGVDWKRIAVVVRAATWIVAVGASLWAIYVYLMMR